MRTGKIIQVSGSVVDVRFPHGELPRIREALSVELNGKRISMTDEDLAKIAAEDVEFICDSDAHSVGRVGDFSVPVACIERVGIPYSQIANWERLPRFRSRIAKGLYDENKGGDL